MKKVVFYSYKGGTGRTLALASIAEFAAAIGKSVIAIDMDFEAPGLTYKFGVPSEQSTRVRGLTGALLELATTGELPADLDPYMLPIDLNGRVDSRMAVELPLDGTLRLLPAGNIPSPNYFADLQRLAFDQRAADGSGLALMNALLARLESVYEPDLILIDARTGITPSNTLLLSEIADEVYAFFLDLPEQRDGVRTVLRALMPLLTTDDDDPLALTAVLSRVPVAAGVHGFGWLEGDDDVARRQATAAFLSAPAARLEHTLPDDLRVAMLHHDGGLLRSERTLLAALTAPGGATNALLWDYTKLAGFIIDDPAAIDMVVEPLRATGEGDDVLAVIAHDPSLRIPERGSVDARVADDTAPLADRIAELRRFAELDPKSKAELASALVELSQSHRDLGQQQEAVAPAAEAVEIYQLLAETNATAYFPDLAWSFNNLGNRLSERGRHSEALEPTQRAVEIYRQLAETNPDAYLANSARSLNDLGVSLYQLGRHSEALEPTQRAVEIYRQLAETNPDAYLPELAGALNNLGNRRSETGDSETAVQLTIEATDICRTLAASDTSYRPILAGSLNNLSIRFTNLGRYEEAVELAQEALDIHRELAATSPFAYLPDLAMSLNTLGGSMSRIGRYDEALELAEEALQTRLQLVTSNPDAHEPGLAVALTNLGSALVAVGRPAEALEPARRATNIYLALSAAYPATYLADLEKSLNRLRDLLPPGTERDHVEEELALVTADIG